MSVEFQPSALFLVSSFAPLLLLLVGLAGIFDAITGGLGSLFDWTSNIELPLLLDENAAFLGADTASGVSGAFFSPSDFGFLDENAASLGSDTASGVLPFLPPPEMGLGLGIPRVPTFSLTAGDVLRGVGRFARGAADTGRNFVIGLPSANPAIPANVPRLAVPPASSPLPRDAFTPMALPATPRAADDTHGLARSSRTPSGRAPTRSTKRGRLCTDRGAEMLVAVLDIQRALRELGVHDPARAQELLPHLASLAADLARERGIAAVLERRAAGAFYVDPEADLTPALIDRARAVAGAGSRNAARN